MLVSVNKDWRILRFDLGIYQFNGERENDEAWNLQIFRSLHEVSLENSAK